MYQRGFHPHGERLISDLPDAARAIIERVQPYKRPQPESDPLWVLHRLWNIDKHRSIHVAWWSLVGFVIQTIPPDLDRVVHTGRLHHGQEIAHVTVPSDLPHIEIEAGFQIEVAFDEGGSPDMDRTVIGGLFRLHQYISKILIPEFEPLFP